MLYQNQMNVYYVVKNKYIISVQNPFKILINDWLTNKTYFYVMITERLYQSSIFK